MLHMLMPIAKREDCFHCDFVEWLFTVKEYALRYCNVRSNMENWKRRYRGIAMLTHKKHWIHLFASIEKCSTEILFTWNAFARVKVKAPPKALSNYYLLNLKKSGEEEAEGWREVELFECDRIRTILHCISWLDSLVRA